MINSYLWVEDLGLLKIPLLKLLTVPNNVNTPGGQCLNYLKTQFALYSRNVVGDFLLIMQCVYVPSACEKV